MSLTVILSPAANAEFEEAAAWYEKEADLGESFVDQVQRTLDQIGRMPELHPTIYKEVRRARVRRFPYNLYYRVFVDRVEVIAVFHNKRIPRSGNQEPDILRMAVVGLPTTVNSRWRSSA